MPKPWTEVGRYGSVGIELVVAVLLLAGIGHWLDGKYWPGHDYGMTTGFFLGVAVGVRNLVVAARRMQRDIEQAEARDPEGSRWTVDETWLHKPDDSEHRPPDAHDE